jgi:hypothetical protein
VLLVFAALSQLLLLAGLEHGRTIPLAWDRGRPWCSPFPVCTLVVSPWLTLSFLKQATGPGQPSLASFQISGFQNCLKRSADNSVSLGLRKINEASSKLCTFQLVAEQTLIGLLRLWARPPRHTGPALSFAPMQIAMMDKLHQQMMANIDKASPEALMRSWFTFDPKLAERFQDLSPPSRQAHPRH